MYIYICIYIYIYTINYYKIKCDGISFNLKFPIKIVEYVISRVLRKNKTLHTKAMFLPKSFLHQT